MTINSKFSLLILIVLFARCSSSSQSINSISYHSGGGEMGGYTKIEITTDSINGMFINPNKKIIIKEKTRKTLWDSLTKSATLNDFKQIKSGKSVVHIDGIDISVKIETALESYVLLNGNIDEVQNKKVYHFMEILEHELRNIYRRANH